MRAVNLIPSDARRGADAPSRSGGLVYGVLGLLGVVAVVALAYGLAAHSVDEKEAQLQQLTADSAAAEAQATKLSAYTKFSQMSKERATTVTAIADARFDWGRALREIARVVPGPVDLVSLTGSKGGDANANADAAAAAGATPQFQLIGCASSQSAVALLLARLRAIQGVDRVRLDTSAKADSSSGGGSAPSGGDCRKDESDTQFTATIFFGQPTAASGSTTSSAAAGESAQEQSYNSAEQASENGAGAS